MNYGNHIQANMITLTVLGANNPTTMTAMPDATREIDKTVSGHPPRLCSKLRNIALSLNLVHKLPQYSLLAGVPTIINDSIDSPATAAGSITLVLRIARSTGACRDWSALIGRVSP